MECLLVSHTHWDREWYRTFQLFRARLVDTVDRVLDLVAADPGYRFLLDGQSVVLEDYLEIRPHRRDELVAACTEGRLAVGPWYVQPDSILPSGEAHVRNLLEGRRVAEQVAPRASRVAYTPDSFGHPAQFPQLFAGFGMDAFVYWRGNGDELDDLAPVWRWVAPDGTSLAAVHLGGGYFSAAHLPSDVALAAKKLEAVGAELGPAAGGRVLLMNGSDHLLPDAHVDEVAAALEASTGWAVRRGLLEDFIATLPPEEDQPRWTGDLLGGRLANLLPGVWSTRTWLKVRNRRAESLLTAEAEPWAALAGALDAGDEQPALRLAWRSLLQNQAHDSICGCSVDAVHRQMTPRYEAASELAVETTARLLDRLAGLGPERRVPWSDSFDLAVFNPSPWPRTDVVRFPLEGFPLYGIKSDGTADVHPIALASLLHRGYEVGGRPARLVAVDDPDRVRMVPEQVPTDVEVVVADVPAFGWRRLSLEPAPEVADEVDDGRRIEVAGADDEPVVVEVAADGTLAVTLGQRSWSGLAGLEDLGDRGDSYDADLMDDGEVEVASVEVVRRRHPSGLQSLVVTRRLRVPAGLIEDRSSRSDEAVELPVVVEARLVPGVGRVDLRVAVDNRAEDHRLRLVFPTGAAVAASRSATTFGVARRPVGAPDASRWVHAAHSTFPN
ncbi:MAG: hypothetical protein H0U89_11560, partial [Acidimicrobiia bacterium]|nr:hypothetical protein [Acidimicrobiia bacterium]